MKKLLIIKPKQNRLVTVSYTHLDVYKRQQQQSVAIKGASVTHEAVRQMLKNWKRQGLINILPDARYQKVASRCV